MQRKVEETRAAIKDRTVEASGANDQVKVTASYSRELVRITVDPGFFSADTELALDAIVATANVALRDATAAMEKEIEQATGGIKIPGVL